MLVDASSWSHIVLCQWKLCWWIQHVFCLSLPYLNPLILLISYHLPSSLPPLSPPSLSLPLPPPSSSFLPLPPSSLPLPSACRRSTTVHRLARSGRCHEQLVWEGKVSGPCSIPCYTWCMSYTIYGSWCVLTESFFTLHAKKLQ